MRARVLFAGAFSAAVVVVLGCRHDKPGDFKPKEECVLPPTNQARFDEPPSAAYRKPPAKAEDKSLMGKNQMGGGPLSPGGF
jgi:hypothetical protein